MLFSFPVNFFQVTLAFVGNIPPRSFANDLGLPRTAEQLDLASFVDPLLPRPLLKRHS